MKFCPKCKNKGFKPTEGFTKPLLHKGKKNFNTVSIRYYYCMNCGAKFKTAESLQEFIKELDLFPEEGELEIEHEDD